MTTPATPADTILVSWSDWLSGSREIVRLSSGDIEAPGLVDAVLHSLLDQRRARDGDPIPDGAPRGGWWADLEWGSRLWLLQYATTRAEIPRLAQDYAEEALAWMVDEGIAERVTVTAERQGRDRLALSVQITRATGPDVTVRFADLWEAVL